MYALYMHKDAHCLLVYFLVQPSLLVFRRVEQQNASTGGRVEKLWFGKARASKMKAKVGGMGI